MNHCMIIINRQYGRIILKNFDNSLSKSLSSSSSLSMNHPFSWNHLSSSNHPLSSSTSIKQNDIKFALLNKQCSFDCSTSQQFSNSHLNAYQYRNIHKLFINSTRDINKFDTCNINSCLLYYSNVQRRNLCSSNNSTNNISSETSKSSNKDDHKPSQSSKSLSIKINLSLLFSNGYFSIRFAQRECLFHFWTPIELVLKMLQEELLSSTNTTAIHCNNIGSKAAKHCLIDDDHNQQQNDFLDQLLIEFDTDSNHNHHHAIPSRYDQIKFGRIEMVAEHYDSNSVDSDDSNIISETSTSSSSSSSTDSESSIDINHSKNTQQSTEHLKKHRYRLAKLMPFGYALLGCNLDEIYFLGSATGIVRISGPDGYQPNVEHSLRIKYKMIDKTMKLKNELEQWHQMNPLDTQTMLFKTKTIDPNLYEQNELVVRVLLEFYRNYFNNNSNNNINNMNHCDCSNITNSHHHHHDGYDGKKMFLQQEHQTLLEQFQPLQQEFIELIDSARKESRRRFKFGGLFLLSAQLGFVARLTYFEYSWDIMEPVTWIMTYTTMVGSFAYYIITSEEYVVPGVERRMIASRFWKLAKSRQFDVKKYKKLKEEIRQLEKRIGKLRARF